MSTSPVVIAEGKTKIIVDARDTNIPDDGCTTCRKVRIISKDDITAGDGAAREKLSGKAKASNMTAVNVFKLLKAKGIPTHFLSWVDDQSFLALHAEMIPLEVVTRRIAAGSYLKRNPDVAEGQMFPMVEYELFYKDDKNHDPLVTFIQDRYIGLLEASEPPTTARYFGTMKLLTDDGEEINYDQIRIIALQVFLILEEAWKDLGVVLYDLKIEFGLVDDGLGGKRLVVADTITNDEWRIRDNKGKQLDKQVFRDAVSDGVTEDALSEISDNYELVAKLSEFLPKFARL